jgi:putative transposase
MPQYRRARIEGSIFFFTVVLADRSSNLLVDQIDRLRRAYRMVQERRPFETIAIWVLPDHIHSLWALPQGDSDFFHAVELDQERLLARPRSAIEIGK